VPARARAVALGGEWLRHVPAGVGFWNRPDPVPSGRWQDSSIIDAIYLASDEETVWAEWYRWLAEAGLPPRAGLPRELWRVRVDGDRVADLRSRRALLAVGLDVPSPGRNSWPAFQEVGHRCWRAGYQGVLAPSAARPAGVTLCLFFDDERIAGVRPLGRPRRITDPPAPPTGMRT
jgi:RES domain-containing protein